MIWALYIIDSFITADNKYIYDEYELKLIAVVIICIRRNVRPVWRSYKYLPVIFLYFLFSICICTDRRNALALRSFLLRSLACHHHQLAGCMCQVHWHSSQDNWPYTPIILFICLLHYTIYHLPGPICMLAAFSVAWCHRSGSACVATDGED